MSDKLKEDNIKIKRATSGRNNNKRYLDKSQVTFKDKFGERLVNEQTKIINVPKKRQAIFDFNFEKIEKSINQMINFFLERYNFQNRVEKFNAMYKRIGGVIDLIQVIKEFPDFCFFDFMHIPNYKSEEAEAYGLKVFYNRRNNFFFCVLIQIIKLGLDIDFIQRHIEMFIKLNLENLVPIDIEVDFFFLLLFGLKDKAKTLLMKYMNHFKGLFKENKELDAFSVFGKMKISMPFEDMTLEMVWIIRKILKKSIERQFYEGIEFLLNVKDDICLYMVEGDIWKKIVLNFDEIDTQHIWKLFHSQISNIDKPLYTPTIQLSHNPIYAPGLKISLEEFKKTKTLGKPISPEEVRRFEEIEQELALIPVMTFTDCLEICFKFSKYDHVFFLINKGLETPGVVNQEVFEICLSNNEDISIEIMNYCINVDNAKESYMKQSLLRKYFRLALRLTKYPQCKKFLFIPPPKDDKYFLLVQHMALQQKKAKIEMLEIEKEKAKKDDYLKLVSAKSESDIDIFEKSIKEERNLIAEASKSINNSIMSSRKESLSKIIEERRSILEQTEQSFRKKKDEKNEDSFELNKTVVENNIVESARIGGIEPKLSKPITETAAKVENSTNQEKMKSSEVIESMRFHTSERNKEGKHSLDSSYYGVRLKSQQEGGEIHDNQQDAASMSNPSILAKNKNEINESGQYFKVLSDIHDKKNSSVGQNQILKHSVTNTPYSNKLAFFDDTGEQKKVEKIEHIQLQKISATSNNNLNPLKLSVSESEGSQEEKPNEPEVDDQVQKQEALENQMNSNSDEVNIHPSMTAKEFNKTVMDMNSTIYKVEKAASNINSLINKKSDRKLDDDQDFILNVQFILIDSLRSGEHVFYCLNLLSAIPSKLLNTDLSEKICKTFLTLTRDEEEISHTRYPLIVCVLAAEFLLKLGKLNAKYTYKCQSVAEIFINLGENLQNAMKEEDILNHFLRNQQDINNRSALEIIAENRFYKLLNNENVASIVNKLWYGTGKNINAFQFFRITRIIGYSNMKHEKYSEIVQNYTQEELVSKSFSFQYVEYINNCSVRYLVDSLSTLMSTILFQVIIYLYVQIKKEDLVIDSSRGTDPYEKSDFYIKNVFASVVIYTNCIQVLMFLTYLKKTKRAIKFNMTSFIDIFTLIAVTLNLINVKTIFFTKDQIEVNIGYNAGHLIDTAIFSIIIICAWARVIMILVTTRSFGPFIRIVYLIFRTMLNFMIIYCCFNTVSAQIFTMFFNQSNESFNEFFKSWVELFNNSLGINNFGTFKTNKIFGDSLLIAYTTITNVMLLNLIVSIADNLYQKYQTEADSENRAVLVLTYERIKWDTSYGLIIILPAPFNLISFPLFVVLMVINNERKEYFNELFSKISYIAIALINFMMLLAAGILGLPLAYLISLVHSIYDNITHMTILSIFQGLLEIAIRPIFLLYYMSSDLILYWKVCYISNSEYIKSKEDQLSLINKPVIDLIRKTLIDYKSITKRKKISIDEVFAVLKINKTSVKDESKESKHNSSKNLNDNKDGSDCGSKQFENNSESNTEKEKDDLQSYAVNKAVSTSNKFDASKSDQKFKQNSSVGIINKLLRRNKFPSLFNKDFNNIKEQLNLPQRNSQQPNIQRIIKLKSMGINTSGELEEMDQQTLNYITNKRINKAEAYKALRYLCDKMADKDRMIDIERTLVLLPFRVKLTFNYLQTMEFLNMKFILKGLRNFFFDNALNNPIYSYKKLQQMLIKITIKMKILQKFIPNHIFENLVKTNEELNQNEIYQKNYANIKRLEQMDELSDFEEEDEEILSHNKKTSRDNSECTTPTDIKSPKDISKENSNINF